MLYVCVTVGMDVFRVFQSRFRCGGRSLSVCGVLSVSASVC